ncbi:Chaperone SurA precursor [Pseudoruegeria aquimaris]|uniref:Parvulin-like PPIase n=1 Tax=Pseudoruegeria aquimaris TaxID=393663 RepID=A0A1Y5R7V0_9RHOB|nr:peptidylprolyl isomerase [Pseudoruegeria aquimaris]SLN11160.1 Chaperone SurA precursor [Pseudoruegeria aquimaris]
MKRFSRALLLILSPLLAFAAPAAAQSPFSPVAYVNDGVVTRFELEQRIRFLEVLGTPGDLREEALERLIEDRLQSQAAAQFNLSASDEEIARGIDEFASRANLTGEQFLAELSKAGVAPQTVRDFVASGLVWRELIRGLFGPRSQVTEAEIDRALAYSTGGGGVRVLLSEIVLPTAPEFQERTAAILPQLRQIRSVSEFSAAASQYSVAPSRANGGRLDWRSISSLPPQIAPQILALRPGEITDPIQVPNAIVLFQLRDKQEVSASAAQKFTVEFAQYFIAGGRSEEGLRQAARIREEVDTCDDLYGVNKGKAPEALRIEALPEAEVPADIRRELDDMDPGEVSTALTRNNGQTLVFLMLCGRTPELGDEVNRADIRRELVNARLVSYAASYIAQLRSDAVIRFP